jgi:hypothetical protein
LAPCRPKRGNKNDAGGTGQSIYCAPKRGRRQTISQVSAANEPQGTRGCTGNERNMALSTPFNFPVVPVIPVVHFFQVRAANEPRGTPRGRAATTAGRPCLCPVGTLENSPAIYRWDSISERQASRRDARGAMPPVDSTVPPGRCILCRFYPSDKSLGYFQTPLTGRQRS